MIPQETMEISNDKQKDLEIVKQLCIGGFNLIVNLVWKVLFLGIQEVGESQKAFHLNLKKNYNNL